MDNDKIIPLGGIFLTNFINERHKKDKDLMENPKKPIKKEGFILSTGEIIMSSFLNVTSEQKTSILSEAPLQQKTSQIVLILVNLEES